ncbi:MAG: hypothetical protein ACLSHO_05675 [Dysosmobacter sp.]
MEGSGLVKAKTSETISLTTAGTVMDVFVEEGQKVEQGTPVHHRFLQRCHGGPEGPGRG